ncbi:MAG: hypothetical protein QOG94_600 [Solirubrobacteraceae bacterium]|nr:hypothetical protein [Solirubrobacteraceae bacterium]
MDSGAAVAPPAPWHSSVHALLWCHPATPSAGGELPQPLAARRAIPITIGGLISYVDGPVGPYREIFGAPLVLRPVPPVSRVAFMAVDSAASVAGGRGNWALPKVLASFEGEPGRPGRVTARGDGWEVRVTATARARRIPAVATFRCAQPWPDGIVREFSVRMRGAAQLARVEVEHRAPSPLSGWLTDGRHVGVVISGTQNVSVARARA